MSDDGEIANAVWIHQKPLLSQCWKQDAVQSYGTQRDRSDHGVIDFKCLTGNHRVLTEPGAVATALNQYKDPSVLIRRTRLHSTDLRAMQKILGFLPCIQRSLNAVATAPGSVRNGRCPPGAEDCR